MNFDERFIVLDIETTGLMFEIFEEPTEIAAIEVINRKKGLYYHEYLKPGPTKLKTYNKNFLLKIFGKTLIKDLNVKKFSEVKKAIELLKEDTKEEIEYKRICEEKQKEAETLACDMLKNVTNGKSKYKELKIFRDFVGDSIVVAHNAKFDVNFLNFWLNIVGLPLITNYICTMENYKVLYEEKVVNLGACCENLDIELNGAHNALEDTNACADLFLKEIEDYEEDIELHEVSLIEAYANFKRRVIKQKYFSQAYIQLTQECKLPENIEDLDENIIIDCKQKFVNFKKPLEVSKITSLDLSSVELIFLSWVNCLNINKHLDLINDDNLQKTIREMLLVCNRDFDKLRELNLLLFEKEPNNFLFKLIDKLDNEQESMEYDLIDLHFYFNKNCNLENLKNKINKPYGYIFDFLFQWIGTDVSRINQYSNLIKINYKADELLCGSDFSLGVTNALNSSKDKIFILRNIH